MIGGSKQTNMDAKPTEEIPYATATLSIALDTFLRNGIGLASAEEDFIANYGKDDPAALTEHLAKVVRRPAAGYLEGFQSAVTAIKINEAVNNSQKLAFKPEWYELS